jgi:hypothetical protein
MLRKLMVLASVFLIIGNCSHSGKGNPAGPVNENTPFQIDSSKTTVFNNDTTSDSILRIVLMGSESGSQFRWHLDSSTWTEWAVKGIDPLAISFDKVDTGFHSVNIQSMDSPDGQTFDSVITFYHAAKPSITSTCDTILYKVEQSACTLWVQAQGSGPLQYQWICKGDTIKGVTSEIVILKNLSAVDSGFYQCIISSKYGVVKSAPILVSVFKSSAKELTSFEIVNPSATGTIDENTKTVIVSVPYGTDLSALVAKFTTTGVSVKVGAKTQVSGTTGNNFSSDVVYTVKTTNGTTQDYTVIITALPDNANELTSFSFPALGVKGIIKENAISVNVPYGTDATNLAAGFVTTGKAVKVGSKAQESSVSTNDFSSPVTYTVSAADGSTSVYEVTVAVSSKSTNVLFSFAIVNPEAAGVIDESAKTISLTVPYGTDLGALVATFETSGDSVTVGEKTQTNAATVNNFTNPVTYTVHAAGGTTRMYVATVNVSPETQKTLTSFGIVNPPVSGTIDETKGTVSVTVPVGTSFSSLTATFIASGMTVKIDGKTQVSGTTNNDFSSPVTYTVTAADSSTRQYVVTVKVAAASAMVFTSFGFTSLSAGGIIDETKNTVSVTVPYGTDRSALAATFATSGVSVMVDGKAQVSGATIIDFTRPVTYTISAADGDVRDYVVSVTVPVAFDSAKTLGSFEFTNPVAKGIIDQSKRIVSVTVPYGTERGALSATFTTTGASVRVDSSAQTSATTVNDFTNPVIYKVVAADKSVAEYTVTVTVAKRTAKELTSFRVEYSDGKSTNSCAAVVNQTTKNIKADLSSWASSTIGTAYFTVSPGAIVKVNDTVRVSGVTSFNFAAPVTYTVVAEDGATQDYTVTVTVPKRSAKELTEFRVGYFSSPNTIVEYADINQETKKIQADLSYFVTATTGTAYFIVSPGATVNVKGTIQNSGETKIDLTSPVTYTVVAENGTTQDYTVTVTVPNRSALIEFQFYYPGFLVENGVISEDNHTVSFNINNVVSVNRLKANFSVFPGATVYVNGTVQESGVTVNDFTSPVTYTVVSDDGTKQDYTVTVTVPVP